MREKSQGSYQRFGCSHKLLFSKPVKEAAEGEEKRTFQRQGISVSTILHALPHYLNLGSSSKYHNSPFCCDVLALPLPSHQPPAISLETPSHLLKKIKHLLEQQNPSAGAKGSLAGFYPPTAQGNFTRVTFMSHKRDEIKTCARRCRGGTDGWVCPPGDQAGILRAWESCL